ncbi:MAG: type II toxin-antitoxin system death-on-curing family toxin [Planctomycetota bacterium]|nr:type II toxin-antitoxin system death-on-curing family toxin [Planctomycetota bacterium]
MEFLSAYDILTLHADQIDRYGGECGVRDLGLLDSAAAQAKATFGGEFLHTDVFEMGAAYLFHIVKNHPFVDGNKRAGLAAALVFLDLNGVEIDVPKGALYELTMAVAAGQADKTKVAEFLRTTAAPG